MLSALSRLASRSARAPSVMSASAAAFAAGAPAPTRGFASTKMLPPLRVAVTGAAGAIGYQLCMRIASGEMLGKNQPVYLNLIETKTGLKPLKGVAMELQDGAFPLLKGIVQTDDLNTGFGDCNFAVLVGAKPRGPGMERKDLLADNASIFKAQGEAINKSAKKDIKVLVVGNPANTNALVLAANAPDIYPDNIMAMTRLDQNRAVALLAEKAACDVTDIERVVIWGNHSATQYPDISHAVIKGKWAKASIDAKWYTSEFIPRVQKRGAEIISARGASSAASAASAAIDHMRDLWLGDGGAKAWHSIGCVSDAYYGIEPDLWYSVPCECPGGDFSRIYGIPIDEFSAKLMNATMKELMEERDGVRHLMNPKWTSVVTMNDMGKKLKEKSAEFAPPNLAA